MRKFLTVPIVCLSISCGVLLKEQSGSRVLSDQVDVNQRKEIESTLRVKDKLLHVTWFLPKYSIVKGWVLLQHGFARSRKHVHDLAERLAENGMMVVTPTLTSDELKDGNLALEMANTLLENPNVPEGEKLPERFVLVGHSMGGEFVSNMAAQFSKKVITGFKGLLLLDAVDVNRSMLRELEKTKGIDVMALLAQPSWCNMLSNVTGVLKAFKQDREFVGLRLSGGTHCDAEGDSTDSLCTLVCGPSTRKNIGIVRDFASHWVESLITGLTDVEYFPGGTKFEGLLTGAGATRL